MGAGPCKNGRLRRSECRPFISAASVYRYARPVVSEFCLSQQRLTASAGQSVRGRPGRAPGMVRLLLQPRLEFGCREGPTDQVALNDVTAVFLEKGSLFGRFHSFSQGDHSQIVCQFEERKSTRLNSSHVKRSYAVLG